MLRFTFAHAWLRYPTFSKSAYSRASRDIVAVLSVFSAIFIHIGFSLYTGAVVLNGIFGIELSKTACVLAIALLTGVYTIIGGLTAVVVTESLQTLILLAGAIVITLVGWFRVGGWHGIATNVPEMHLTLLRSADEPGGLPWYSLVLRLSGNRHLVLVHRSDNRAARSGCAR